MSQKSSVPQLDSSVSQTLKRDSRSAATVRLPSSTTAMKYLRWRNSIFHSMPARHVGKPKSHFPQRNKQLGLCSVGLCEVLANPRTGVSTWASQPRTTANQGDIHEHAYDSLFNAFARSFEARSQSDRRDRPQGWLVGGAVPLCRKCSSFIQDLIPDARHHVRLGPARGPFQNFTGTKLCAELSLMPSGETS
jgi:hypothetical protein